MSVCGNTKWSNLSAESSSSIKAAWNIKHILCRCKGDIYLTIESPKFEFSHVKWWILARVCIQNVSLNEKFVLFELNRESAKDRIHEINFKAGLRDSERRLQYTSKGFKRFENSYSGLMVEIFRIRREELEAKRKELMPEDSLTVVCELQTGDVILKEQERTECGSSIRTNVDILVADMGLLLEERKDCDVTLNLGDETFQAHKIILKARSSVFASMFEHDMEENRTSVVNVQDIRPSDFEVMLKYIYTGNAPQLSIEQAFGVYSAADKYDLKNLISRCRNRLVEELPTDWFFEIAAFAATHNDGKLMDAVKQFVGDDFRSILSSAKCQDFFRDHSDIALEILRYSSSILTPKT